MASLAVSADASGGLPRMTKELLLASCLENDGYETPELNDNLCLQRDFGWEHDETSPTCVVGRKLARVQGRVRPRAQYKF